MVVPNINVIKVLGILEKVEILFQIQKNYFYVKENVGLENFDEVDKNYYEEKVLSL